MVADGPANALQQRLSTDAGQSLQRPLGPALVVLAFAVLIFSHTFSMPERWGRVWEGVIKQEVGNLIARQNAG